MAKKSWSRLIDTDMGNHIAEMMKYDGSGYNHYHNIHHVNRLYDIAREWGIGYNPNLDAAILWHDAVYDNGPRKEERSAELMLKSSKTNPQWFDGVDVEKVYSMIQNTETHELDLNTNSTLIMLDVAELADPDQRYMNFWLILRESVELYDISIRDAAIGTVNFMQSFKNTMEQNSIKDRVYSSFWAEVAEGCQDVEQTAKVIYDLFNSGLMDVS